MKTIKDAITARQAAWAAHPFFTALAREERFDDGMRFAPLLAFWVLTFQDVLRINARAVKEPLMRRLARHHRAEDKGHERWFLADLETLGHEPIDASTLFGKEHEATRDAAFAIMSEVFHATDDRVRVILLLTLESAGHVFFGRVTEFVERCGQASAMRYFGPAHLEIERGHEVFERDMEVALDAIVLDESTRRDALALVDRVYCAFERMFDVLALPASRSSAAA